jgi:hypothetical protein
MQTEDIKTFTSGAQSSSQKAGYWMIPFVVLQAVAKRFDLGAQKYDAHNWKRGCEDGAFMRDRFNHLFEHLMKFKEGGDEEDDMEGSIIAVLINAVFLTYWTIMHRSAVEAAFPTQAPARPQAAQPRPNALSPRPLESTTSIAGIPTPVQPPLKNQKPLPQDSGGSQYC